MSWCDSQKVANLSYIAAVYGYFKLALIGNIIFFFARNVINLINGKHVRFLFSLVLPAKSILLQPDQTHFLDRHIQHPHPRELFRLSA